MSVLPISEAIIRHKSNASSYSRGEDYYRRGAVYDVKKRGNSLQASVEGSEIKPYRVSVNFDAGGITLACCSCLYDYDGWCKHIVATLLTCTRASNAITERPTSEQLLDKLDHLQTQRLVQELLRKNPELIDDIDSFVSLLNSPPSNKKSPPSKRRSQIDVTPIRSQVRRILRDGLRELEYGSEDDPFTEELTAIIEQAQEFARQSDGTSAIAILEAITSTYAEEWDELAEYGGDCYSIAEPLDIAWTEAILCADIPEAEAKDLQIMLESWQDEIAADFGMSLEALKQGWNYEPLQQIVAGNTSIKLWQEDTRPDFADDLISIRLDYLERQNRYSEYLNLSFAEGMMQQYLTKLAALGRIDEAMSVAKTQMDTAETAFALAMVLRDDGYLSEALLISRLGLHLSGNRIYEFASWTSNFAEGMGDTSTALNASMVAFEAKPSFRDYQKVENLAADAWSQIKPDLLEIIRELKHWYVTEAKVDIFLHEGLIDEAIATVSSNSYYASELLERVMDAAIPHRPDWVITKARQLAEDIMNRGKADRYDNAVRWLKKVKAAYVQLGKQSEWSAYRAELENIHGRKRKLMELFKGLNKV
ncbi:SWIM zinc finger family protein [Calothrix sp. UHCC 0171]|uniref:SWIM zinc finger family protein n=1 Tax=Calothrix sp. UHCC 0171 TaxID=3110245 RepID=UPI002B1EAB45|nr:SWIM zinc finger family protein [Calothrix sp. UHCC 0171]MEA5573418.1 SWIM zinc finger family protein [Calothrix sp. UHCC 0171]